jgi:azurin
MINLNLMWINMKTISVRYYKGIIFFFFITCFFGISIFITEMNANIISNNHHDGISEKYISVIPDSGRIIEIKSTGIELSYDVTEIRAKAGDTLTIQYDNSESDMAHNIVLVRTEEDIMPVGIAAMQAYRNDYIPEDEMDRIIAYSKLAHPGDIIEFSFVVPSPGTYPYICTYSGHFTMMQGRLISEE